MISYEVYVTLPDDEIVYHGDIPGMLEVFANEVRAHPDGDIQLNFIGDDDPYTLLYYHERKLANVCRTVAVREEKGQPETS